MFSDMLTQSLTAFDMRWHPQSLASAWHLSRPMCRRPQVCADQRSTCWRLQLLRGRARGDGSHLLTLQGTLTIPVT